MTRLIACAVFLILAAQGHAALSGTKSIGPSGDYSSITAAIADIKTQGLGGPLILELQAAYVSTVETFPLSFSNLGTSITKPITLRPAADATALSISCDTNVVTLSLSNVTFITLDGRPGGLGTTKQLTIANASTSSSAVRLDSEASNNTLQYLTLQGVNTNGIGVVAFGSTSGANGNDNNLIDHCDIGDGASKPAVAIISSGNTTSTAKFNSNNTISNCHIFNFSTSTGAAYGINLGGGNTDWTIYGNSFYGSIGGSSGTRGIYINSSSGNNFNVTHNFFGGTAASASGTTVVYTTPTFAAIYLNVGTVVPSVVQETVVQLVGVSSSTSYTSLPGICCGIYVLAGSVDIKNNSIGLAFDSAMFGTTNTFGASASVSAAVYGIGSSSTGTVNILNNAVGGMVAYASGNSSTVTLTGIEADGGNSTISGNIVGNATLPDSFKINGNIPGSISLGLIGIGTQNSKGAVISNNTVTHLNANCSYSGISAQVRGIYIANGINTVSNNAVHHLSTNAANTVFTEGNVSGISIAQSTVPGLVSHNLVYALSDTVTTASQVGVMGIYYIGSASSADVLDGNFVHSLSNSSTDASSFISGIHFETAGMCTVQNNMVRMGLDESGVSTGTSGKVYGIRETSGGPSYYHNSIYVGGTQVSGAATSIAFQGSTTTNPHNYSNNIFANARNRTGTATGNNYAVFFGGSPASLTADHNLFFVSGTGGILGRYSSVDRTDLASWQAATGLDANSIVGDPLFNNPTGTSATVDLHLQNASPAHNAGVAVSGITKDIDGQTRSATTPDIGADELGQPDISVEQPSGTALVDGLSTVDYGTVIVGGNAVIKFFTLRNLGTASLTGLTFTLDGVNAADFGLSQTSSTPLAPGASEFISVTFLPGSVGIRKATLHIASNDFDEPSFDIALTGKAQNANATYQQWAQTNGVSNDPSTQGANSLQNLLNFGFAINPGGTSTGPLVFNGNFGSGGTIAATGMPVTRQESNDLRALFVRRKDYATVGLVYTAQFSSDLSSWQDSTDTPTVLADDGTNQIVSVPYPAGFTASGFFQVKVSLP